WLASTISMRAHGTAWPCRVTTSPSSGPGQASSKARAIAAEALPAPTTTVRPATGAGRCATTARRGSAAASAASNRAFSVSAGATLSRVIDSRFRLANRPAISYRARRKGQCRSPARAAARRGDALAQGQATAQEGDGRVRSWGRHAAAIAAAAAAALAAAPGWGQPSGPPAAPAQPAPAPAPPPPAAAAPPPAAAQAPAPAAAASPEPTPFAEVFSRLAHRVSGVVVNISTTQAVSSTPSKAAADAQPPSPGSSLDDFFRDFFGDHGAPNGSGGPRIASLGSGFIVDP